MKANSTAKASDFSRRSFLKGAAVLTAAGAIPLIGGCSPSEPEDKTGSSGSAEEIAWDHEADIIAIGGGAAGLSCGIEGTEQGLSVIVLESQNYVGGSSALCNGGIAMPNTPLQKEQGIKDSAELFFEDLNTMTQSDNNPEWLKMHCELAEGLWEWLTGMGLEFKAESLLPTQGASVPREHHIVPTEVIDALQERAVADGAEIMVKTTATELIQDAQTKRVIGVRAEDSSGKEINIKANKGVVLATNGYSRNYDMLNQYVFGTGAENVMTFTGTGDLGQGHLMAMSIGADTRHLGWISLLTGQHPDGSGGQSCSLIHGGAVMVNVEGERFVNESLGYGNVWVDVASQTNGMCWQIWDEDIAIEYAQNDSSLYSMEKLRNSGLLVSADTLEELAELIDVPASTLTSTINAYNDDINSKGADSLFNRSTQVSNVGTPPAIDTPPFYAWKTGNVCYGTSGGIKHNLDMQVLHINGDPIPGLYCAGTISTYSNMGIVPGTIKAVGASGTGFGGALIWGRRVAQIINEKEQ